MWRGYQETPLEEITGDSEEQEGGRKEGDRRGPGGGGGTRTGRRREGRGWGREEGRGEKGRLQMDNTRVRLWNKVNQEIWRKRAR